MALIGQIAISMVTDTTKFTQGLFGARGALAAFEKSAYKDIRMGSKSIKSGLKDITKGFDYVKAGWNDQLRGSIPLITKGFFKIASGLDRMAFGMLKLPFAFAAQGFHKFVGITRSAINELGMFAAIGSGVAAFALARVAKGAIALGEQTDRSRVVFGEFAQGVINDSQTMATAFGVSRKSFVQAASAFGTIFEGVGYSKKDAADLSVHFVKLATDLSSLVHIPVQEAMEKIQSGLAGQVRPLREVGVFMSEEGVAAKAAAMGIAKLGTELTESQKVQARVAFITEHLAIAHGNLADTAGSAGNQIRSLAGRFENLSDTAGTALLTVLGPAVDELNIGITALQTAWDASSFAALSATTGVLGAAQTQTESIGWIQKAVGAVADGWQTMVIIFYRVQSSITSGIGAMVSGLGVLAKALDRVLSMVGRSTGTADFFKTWAEDLDRLSNQQYKTFEQELIKPLPSEAINDYFTNARNKIAAARAELAKPQTDVTKLKPVSAAAAKTTDVKFASAHELNSREGANMILRSKYGAGVAASKAPEKTAENTAKAASSLEQIKNMLARQAANPAVGLPMIEIT